MKTSSPLLGFNNNVRHKGRVFHIQTEDSGVKHPHIITHLFADGGRILKTTKTSYAEHVGSANISDTVRQLMQEQHKGMFIALRDGQFDHLLEELPPAPPGASAANPAGMAVGMAARIVAPATRAPAAPVAAPPVAQAQAIQAHVTAGARPAADGVNAAVAKVEAQPGSQDPKLGNAGPSPGILSPEKRNVSPTAATMIAHAPTEAPPASAPNEVDLDLDTLERAAAEAQATPYYQQINDLPPPPAAVLGKRASDVPPRDTSYRTVATTTHVVEPPPPPPVAPAGKSAPVSPSSGRYAPSRPAAIFHNARPAEGASIFGEDLISEKSLDEVILSYLAEDLDAPSEKK